jgi:hydrogenase maturation protease
VTVVAFALGNALRADDGAGLALGRGLAELVPGLVVVEAELLLPEHADVVAGARGVLFLDASVAGPPGEVRGTALGPAAEHGALLHALTPGEVLALARALHGRSPPAALVTVAGRDFSFGEALSPEVEAALPAARERAREIAQSFRRVES